jgi:hypothetical protein
MCAHACILHTGAMRAHADIQSQELWLCMPFINAANVTVCVTGACKGTSARIDHHCCKATGRQPGQRQNAHTAPQRCCSASHHRNRSTMITDNVTVQRLQPVTPPQKKSCRATCLTVQGLQCMAYTDPRHVARDSSVILQSFTGSGIA